MSPILTKLSYSERYYILKVLGYHIRIGKLIFGIHLMIPRVLHDPNATEKKTPGSCLIASFDQNITPYIIHGALKLCYKGLGV